MIKNLRKRFIAFNIVVIFCVIVILSFIVSSGTKSNLTVDRYVVAIVVSLVLVFIASYIISKFALKPVKHAWQKQLDFTADASHELRTPLAVIKTNLEIVLDNPNETVESQLKWLKNIEIEHTRMTKLVEDLLTLSRADTGEQSLFTSTFLLDETAQVAINTFQSVCKQKELDLTHNIETNILFCGDEKRISQLIIIFLDNAVQYTQPKGSISFELHKKENEIKISVQDTGAGISKEDTTKIFERFYRANNTRQQNPDGSGLGLSIAKWIVEQHKGKICVDSKLGEGTIFSVVFHAP